MFRLIALGLIKIAEVLLVESIIFQLSRNKAHLLPIYPMDMLDTLKMSEGLVEGSPTLRHYAVT
jgi:hypothetical protein